MSVIGLSIGLHFPLLIWRPGHAPSHSKDVLIGCFDLE
jgi:hypothetical protein